MAAETLPKHFQFHIKDVIKAPRQRRRRHTPDKEAQAEHAWIWNGNSAGLEIFSRVVHTVELRKMGRCHSCLIRCPSGSSPVTKDRRKIKETLFSDLERITILQGLKLRETNIRNIVDDSVNTLPKTDGITIEVQDSLADEAVWIDHDRIVKVLVELEINAMEAMPDGGRLQILVKDNSDRIFLTIRDTGRGISKEDMDLLFTPFFTTKPAGEGTGLGLPSAYGVVKAHGGHLTVESNADPSQGPTGTTIHISLPRRPLLKDKQGTLILHEE